VAILNAECIIKNDGFGIENGAFFLYSTFSILICAISQLIERGERLSARIVRLQQSDNPWNCIRFQVAVDG